MITLKECFDRYTAAPSRETLDAILSDAKAQGVNDQNLIYLVNAISYKVRDAGMGELFTDLIERDAYVSRLSPECARLVKQEQQEAIEWKLALEEEGITAEEAIGAATDALKQAIDGKVN